MIINTRAANMKGTQLTCAEMRLSSPSQYCVQLCSRAPASAEGERNNLEKLSHFLFNTQPFRLTTQSVQDNIPSSLILPGLQLPWRWRGDTGVAGGCLWLEPLSILWGLALLSVPGQSPLGQVPTPGLLPVCGLLPASSPHGHFLEPRGCFPSHRACGSLGWWELR